MDRGSWHAEPRSVRHVSEMMQGEGGEIGEHVRPAIPPYARTSAVIVMVCMSSVSVSLSPDLSGRRMNDVFLPLYLTDPSPQRSTIECRDADSSSSHEEG